MKKRWKFALAIALAAVLLIAGVALALVSGNVLEMLKVDMVVGTDAYVDYLNGAVQVLGARGEGECAAVELTEAVYADGTLALTWTVEAKGRAIWVKDCDVLLDGKPLDMLEDAPKVNGAAMSPSATSYNMREFLLQSGEKIACGARFSPRALPDRADVAVEIALIKNSAGDLETVRAEAVIDRVPTVVRSALDDGQPLEYAFPGYELRVVRADQTLSKLEVEMQYIVADRQAAVEFDWAEMQMFTADGAQENWSLSGCVSAYGDMPLKDGRYAFTVLISQVLRRPYDEFTIVQQKQLDWDELPEHRGELNWDETVTLKFE